MLFDVVIVGAGPGGLACATTSAEGGLKTLVLERGTRIGKKVCAGGVTWNGLLKTVPESIIERQFPQQRIYTRLQEVTITEQEPIIATVNRERLGKTMAQGARQAGAVIRPGCRATAISGNTLSFYDTGEEREEKVTFRYLIGGDGSSSFVRRHLGLPVRRLGIGINYQLPGEYENMVWHLDSSRFKSGYAWIFPHRKSISIGAYVDSRVMKAAELKKNILLWAEEVGVHLADKKCEAEYINFDYRGYRFNNIFLVGDAAGLASGLTGEGIYPAIISGKAAAKSILAPQERNIEMEKMIRNQLRHRKMVTLLGKNRLFASLSAELVAFCLRMRVLPFRAIEMAR